MFSWNDYCQYEYTIKTYDGRIVDYVTYTEEGLKEALTHWGDQIVSFGKVYLGKRDNDYVPPRISTQPDIPYVTATLTDIPDPCRGCPTHPSNGGSGICNCTLGLPKIT